LEGEKEEESEEEDGGHASQLRFSWENISPNLMVNGRQ